MLKTLLTLNTGKSVVRDEETTWETPLRRTVTNPTSGRPGVLSYHARLARDTYYMPVKAWRHSGLTAEGFPSAKSGGTVKGRHGRRAAWGWPALLLTS